MYTTTVTHIHSDKYGFYLSSQTTIHDNDCKNLKEDLKRAEERQGDAEAKVSRLQRDNRGLNEKVTALEKEKMSCRDQIDSNRGSIQ